VVAGHNDRIAWGLTNVSVDGMDFYIEKINPDNPNQYLFNGQWRDLEVRKEKIKTSDGEIIEKELRFTHRGPIISQFKDVEDMAVSMRWIGNMFSNEPRTVYLLNRAGNWSEFQDAVKTFISISQNIIYADVDGNIGLYCCAGVPIRPKGDGVALAPGWTDEYDWTGLVPFEQLPHTYNPDRGFVASANNKTTDNDYPYYISTWYAPPYRIDRITEMLLEKDKLSTDDFKRMQGDHKSKLVEEMHGGLVRELSQANNWTDLEKRALEIFTAWDGVLTTASPGASIFEEIYGNMIKNLFLDEMGADLYEEYTANGTLPIYGLRNVWTSRQSAWCDDVSNRDVTETLTDVVVKSFKGAVARFKDELGEDPDQWQWGRIHKLSLNHPMGGVDILNKLLKLNRGPFEVGGSFHTVSPYSYRLAKRYQVTNGASHRHVYSLIDWDKSQTVIPTGVSGIPASRHYCDQSKMYVENEYHTDYVSRELIARNARYKMEITGR